MIVSNSFGDRPRGSSTAGGPPIVGPSRIKRVKPLPRTTRNLNALRLSLLLARESSSASSLFFVSIFIDFSFLYRISVHARNRIRGAR